MAANAQSAFNQADSMVDGTRLGWKLGDLLLTVSSSVNSLDLSKNGKIAFGSAKSPLVQQFYNNIINVLFPSCYHSANFFYVLMKRGFPCIDLLLFWSQVKQQGRDCQALHNQSLTGPSVLW